MLRAGGQHCQCKFVIAVTPSGQEGTRQVVTLQRHKAMLMLMGWLLVNSCCCADGPCPLTAEPEVTTHQLQEGDEFMLLGCDGLWDVFPSQRAVEFARHRCVNEWRPWRAVLEILLCLRFDSVVLFCIHHCVAVPVAECALV